MRLIKFLIKMFRAMSTYQPKEGEHIVYVQRIGNETFVYDGIVHYHNDSERFYIKTETNTICCVEPF